MKTLYIFTVGLALLWGTARAEDNAGVQVQTRGPVHEAFAGVITFNPTAGPAITKEPPDLIEELPPEEKPEGDNVTWIPGYWAWDDERNDFLWISGVWRALPPGRQWIAGYWRKTDTGFQWISGYWQDKKIKETVYLPEPPASIETGPNIDAPTADCIWVPGYWVWHHGRYAWRPGYWVVGQPDWVWSPSYYVWTPRGYVFVDGYWDYPVVRRGVLFAPVYFSERRHYRHCPTVVIETGVFSDHLFVRPAYSHYYFGDYYATTYSSSGFYASFTFYSSRRGYDPICAYDRWDHRRDRDWDRRRADDFQHRRDHEDARPPRTWDDRRASSTPVATTLDQAVKKTDAPLRYQKVTPTERQTLTDQSRQVHQSTQTRRTTEGRSVEVSAQSRELERARATRPTTTPKAVAPAPEAKEPESPQRTEGRPVHQAPSRTVERAPVSQPKQEAVTESRETESSPAPQRAVGRPVHQTPSRTTPVTDETPARSPGRSVQEAPARSVEREPKREAVPESKQEEAVANNRSQTAAPRQVHQRSADRPSMVGETTGRGVARGTRKSQEEETQDSTENPTGTRKGNQN